MYSKCVFTGKALRLTPKENIYIYIYTDKKIPQLTSIKRIDPPIVKAQGVAWCEKSS